MPTRSANLAAATAAAQRTTGPLATISAQGGPLKIGLLFDYTGALAEFGPNMETGAQLAVKQINAAGGVLGKPIQLITADSGTNRQVAVEAATRLVNVEGVQGIVGSLASGVTIAAAEGVTVPNKILMISPASTSPGLTAVKDDDFLFRTVLSDAAQGIVLADWAWEQGYKKVSTFYTYNAYGKGLSDQFVASFEAEGGTVLAAVSHEQGQTTYLPELQMAVEGKPDALVAISYPAEGRIYLREAVEHNLIKTFLFTDGTKSQDIIDAVGAAALEGTTGTSPSTTGKSELTANFDADYKAEYGTDVPALPYIRESYDAVVLIAVAAEAAQSTDPTKIRDQLRNVAGPPGQEIGAGADGIRQALQAVRVGTDIDFEGAANSDNFDKNGDVTTGDIEIFKITGGQFWTVKVVPVSLGAPAATTSTLREARISALGFTPIGTPVSTDDGSGGSLVALKGICVGSADGYCQQVFFFRNTEYLGTDMLSPSASILDVQYAGVAKIDVTYANYAPSDPFCCPSLSPVTITYSWDGAQLKASGVPPGH